MIRHHPREVTLQMYAAGDLAPALFIVVDVHLAFCAGCRNAVSELEAAEAQRLMDAEPVGLAEGSWDCVSGRLDDPIPAPPPQIHPLLPPPLDRLEFGRWWPLTPRLRWRTLRIGGEAWGGLMLVQPGGAIPAHRHTGRELTCVLAGAFSDGNSLYQPGDLADPVHDHDHPLSVAGEQVCLCVMASEGLQLRGVMGIIQSGFEFIRR